MCPFVFLSKYFLTVLLLPAVPGRILALVLHHRLQVVLKTLPYLSVVFFNEKVGLLYFL